MKGLVRQAHGSAAVEFALLVPMLALMLASFSDLSNVIGVALIVDNAAREGARAVVAYDTGWSGKVTGYLSAAGVSPANGEAVGAVSCATCSPFPPAAGSEVTVSVPVTVTISMPIVQQILGATVTVTGSASMEML
jgi:Flp pilus assembly protein TadG